MEEKTAVSATEWNTRHIRWIAGLEILSWWCLIPNRGRNRRFALFGIIKKGNGLQLAAAGNGNSRHQVFWGTESLG
jgi:hypothetical protein